MGDDRLEVLFKRLDVKNQGYLDVDTLSLIHKKYAKDLVSVCDSTNDGRITLQEFKHFAQKKEAELLKLFKSLARDDVIHYNDLKQFVAKENLNVSPEQLRAFLATLDSDNDGLIEYYEWRDFFNLLPHTPTLGNLIEYHSILMDVNSDAFPTGNISYFLAGGIAGAVSRTATAPLDRLRLYLQTNLSQQRMSWIDAFRQIYKHGGIFSFYKGNGLNILKIFPESAFKFYVFEYMKELLGSEITLMKRFLAGGIAGLVSQFMIYPIETVKTRIMSQVHSSITTPVSVSQVIRELRAGGLRSFYRGLGPASIGIVPYAGIDLAVFETLKTSWLNYNGSYTTLHILFMGMTSGSCGALLMYPLSIVRTRLQAQGTPSHPYHYKSSFDVIKQTLKNEGPLGFYKGIGPTLLKVIPSASISYAVYEQSKAALGL